MDLRELNLFYKRQRSLKKRRSQLVSVMLTNKRSDVHPRGASLGTVYSCLVD